MNKHLLKSAKIQVYFLFLFIVLIGCDPYYPITITNTTKDTVEVLLIENIHFKTEKNKIMTHNGFNAYKLQPNEKMKVGNAIAEIDNEIPFDAIMFIKNKDTVSANHPDEIKNLFDKTSDKLVTPYNISIR